MVIGNVLQGILNALDQVLFGYDRHKIVPLIKNQTQLVTVHVTNQGFGYTNRLVTTFYFYSHLTFYLDGI